VQASELTKQIAGKAMEGYAMDEDPTAEPEGDAQGMSESIAGVLRRIEAPGTFATRIGALVDDLEIHVGGVGRLRFPITYATAEKLRRVARPASFGIQDRTLQDLRVRNTWEIAKSRVKLPARPWKRVLVPHLRAIQQQLGLPSECQLKPVLDKMLLYERGQFFKAHQDSEKSDAMVATLVVVLPSQYTGGSLLVVHDGGKKVFHRLKSQSKQLSLIAFYADCYHEVRPVKSGFRVALTYRLLLDCPSRMRPVQIHSAVQQQLSESVREHFATPIASSYPRNEPRKPRRLVYLLDHEYTRRSLSWSQLKRADRLRVGALQTVAERLDCECSLALADVHEIWECEEDSLDWSHGRYFEAPVEDEVEDVGDTASDYRLVDLLDSDVELHHWLDASGKAARGLRGFVAGGELCFTTPSADMDPFESEYEGFQGNYGNTLDRWYHRAALVMWPRENSFVLRAEASPAWAVDDLAALPAGATAELEARVARLLPTWARHAGREEAPRFFSKVMKLAIRIDDAALARGFVGPVGAERLRGPTIRRALGALIQKHGAPWGQELLLQWTEVRGSQDRREWIPLLPGICQDLMASGSGTCQSLARWLIAREASSIRKRSSAALKSRRRWLDLDAFSREARCIAHVLAAAVMVGNERVVQDAARFFAADTPRFPLEFQIQVLEQCSALRSPGLRTLLASSTLHICVVDQLERILAAGPRNGDDWSIVHSLHCECGDCEELSLFLRSNERRDWDWPLNKQRRRHIHGVLDSNELPVRHTTLRRGSPYVLQIRKEQSLFSREQDHQRKLKMMLSRLEAMPAAARESDLER